MWCMRSLINIIYTLHNQLPDFMSTSNHEQLLDREKLMMSCPESSAGSPTQWGLSVNNRMSATEGPLFGEATCQSSLRQRGSRWTGQSEKVPAQQVRDQEVKRHLEWRRAVSGQLKQSDDILKESWRNVLLNITRALGFMLPFAPALFILVVRWCLLKMCAGYSSQSSVYACVCRILLAALTWHTRHGVKIQAEYSLIRHYS